jgi:hypothetical protein
MKTKFVKQTSITNFLLFLDFIVLTIVLIQIPKEGPVRTNYLNAINVLLFFPGFVLLSIILKRFFEFPIEVSGHTRSVTSY